MDVLTNSQMDLADVVCSTEKMITYCRENPARKFIVTTESVLLHRMRRLCPDKEFLCAPAFDLMRLPTDGCRYSECRYMKMNTLEKLRDCLDALTPRVEITPSLLAQARAPIDRMLAA